MTPVYLIQHYVRALFLALLLGISHSGLAQTQGASSVPIDDGSGGEGPYCNAIVLRLSSQTCTQAVLQAYPPADCTFSYSLSGPQSRSGSGKIVNFTVTENGTYTLRASGSQGTFYSDPVTVTGLLSASATPTISAAGPLAFCPGGSVTLTASAGSAYSWSTGATTQSIAVGTVGSYSVAVTNSKGCTATSAPVTVSANTAPDVTLSGPNAICQGGSATLAVPSQSGVSYQWLRDGAAIGGATGASYAVSQAGNYAVTATNGQGCSATSAARTMGVTPLPQVSIATTKATGIDLATSLTASLLDNSAATYVWSPTSGLVGGATGSTVRAKPSVTTTYTVTAVSAAGCVATASVSVPGDNNYNLIAENNILVGGITTEAQLTGLSIQERSQKVTYLDGLGREEQVVLTQSSPQLADVVTPTSYDALGRPDTKYLPYAVGATAQDANGSYKPNAFTEQATFYSTSTTGDNIANDLIASAKSVYDASPLNRVREQGAAGTAWQPGAGHTLKTNVRSNAANEVRQWSYDYSAKTWSSPGYYAAGELQVQENRDEHDALTISFTDKEGHVVLKKIQSSTTAGSVCSVKSEWTGDMQLVAPAGTVITGIQSAVWGRAASGSTCSDIVFDATCSGDVTGQVQRLFTGPTASLTLPVTSQALGETCSGYTKTLKVVANLAPTQATDYTWTYYGYNGFGQLGLTIQPEGSKILNAQGATIGALTDEFIRSWCFVYRYDAQQRVVEKHVPGAGWTYLVYNRRDQVVGTQNQRQATTADFPWWITKYDALGRPVLTAYTNVDMNRVDLQYELDQLPATAPDSETRTTTGLGYSLNLAYPAVSEASVQTVTFYDDYNYSQLSGKTFVAENGVVATDVSDLLAGQISGKAERVLGTTNSWLVTKTFYDDRYRPIQVQADQYPGGTSRTTSKLDFAGQTVSSLTTHTWNSETHTVRNRYVYDHAGRTQRVFQQMEYGLATVQPEVLVAHNDYNQIGQLVDKKLHSTNWQTWGGFRWYPNSSPAYLQSVDYRYNIRGWLSNINNRNLSNNINDRFNDADANQDDLNKVDQDLFGMELMYNSGQNLALSTPQFNGNITEVMWKTRGKAELQVLRGYSYHYDRLNRLTQADYRTYEAPSYTWTNQVSDYSVPRVEYDANGNITRLERKGRVNALTQPTPVFGDLDKLTYRYEVNGVRSNQLVSVDEDNALSTTATHDFEDNSSRHSNSTAEYGYDATGSMTSDSNKGIAVTYNELNLPATVTLSGNRQIQFTYTASGQKLRKTVTETNQTTKTTDYVSGFVYENNVLQFAPMPEGRVLYQMAQPQPGTYKWKYEYHLKDHLGNLRFAFRDHDGSTQQRTASMEPINATKEEQEFERVAETRQQDARRARTGNYVARLSAAEGRRQGPSISWPVQAGDSVYAEVYGRYDHSAAVGNLVRRGAIVSGAAVAGNPGVIKSDQTLPTAARRRWQPFLTASLAVVPQLLRPKQQELPTAFLRYELFNKDSQLVATRTMPLQRTASDEWQHLEAGITADSAGYVRVSVINESSTPAYFDDMALRPVDPDEFQENHYDPWGLNLVGIEDTGSPDSKFQFNGKEKQSEFGLGWSDYGARMYDPQLGKWNAVDPKADSYLDNSPYNYCINSPVNAVDPTGKLVIFVNGHYNSLLHDVSKRMLGSAITPAGPGRKAYWEHFSKTFIGEASSYFNDTNVAFEDGSTFYGGDENGLQRHARGYEYAKAHYKEYTKGLQYGESVKFVSHSEGSAFAAGMAAYFDEMHKKDENAPPVESIMYLSPDEADEFSLFEADFGTSIRVTDEWDPVSPAFYPIWGGVDIDMRTNGGMKGIGQAHGGTVYGGKSGTIAKLASAVKAFMNDPKNKVITDKDGTTKTYFSGENPIGLTP